MGGGGKGDGGGGTSASTQYQDTMANIANQMYSQTTPMRQSIINQLTAFVGGGVAGGGTGSNSDYLTSLYNTAKQGGGPTQLYQNPFTGELSTMQGWAYDGTEGGNATQYVPVSIGGMNSDALDRLYQAAMANTGLSSSSGSGSIIDALSPVYQAGKKASENQYKVARDAIMANVPMGGGYASAMSDLEANRADSLLNLESTIANDLYNKAYGLATGTPQTSASMLGSAATAANQSAQVAASQQASTNSLLGNLGMAGGYALGTSGKGASLMGAGKGGASAGATGAIMADAPELAALAMLA
jgi:hypothetical protein